MSRLAKILLVAILATACLGVIGKAKEIPKNAENKLLISAIRRVARSPQMPNPMDLADKAKEMAKEHMSSMGGGKKGQQQQERAGDMFGGFGDVLGGIVDMVGQVGQVVGMAPPAPPAASADPKGDGEDNRPNGMASGPNINEALG